MPRRNGLLATAVALTTLASSLTIPQIAAAKDDVERLPRSLEKLAACQAITDNADRLACYDREAATLVTSATQGEVKVVDKEEARTVRKSLFGFQLPQIGLFDGKKDADEAKIDEVLDSTITKVEQTPRGYWRITITEGAIWETNEAPTRLRTPKVGNKVQFEKASLGSYWIRIDGQLGVKGRRVG